MSDYAKERAAASVDPLTAATDGISKAFQDMQAELLNRITSLLSGQEARALVWRKDMSDRIAHLENDVEAIKRHVGIT